MIIFAGDIGNMASGFAYDTYKAAFKSVFGEKIPIIQSIMGNHDYYGLRTSENCRRLFTKKIGSSPFTHYTVNGFHFIGVSPDCEKMSDGYRKILPYLKIEIELAKKNAATGRFLSRRIIVPKIRCTAATIGETRVFSTCFLNILI